jgi:hypothetical protein
MGKTQLTRKQFILGIAGGGVALVLGCGDDETSGTGASSSGAGGGTSSSTGTTSTTSTTSGTSASSSGGTGGSNVGGAGGTGAGTTGQGGSGGSAAVCAGLITAGISNNHGHALEVPLADIDAGIDTTYDVSGTASHCHEVTLTAEDFTTLKNGGTVTKKTCNGGDHEFVLTCASDVPAPGVPDCASTPDQGQCG